jgi:hypothetical protein
MLISLTTLLTNPSSIFQSRAALQLENLALRHQIGVLQRSVRNRPKLTLVDLWVAKTSTATKNETVLGREGLNTILASTEREDFGGQEPVWAYSTHTY